MGMCVCELCVCVSCVVCVCVSVCMYICVVSTSEFIVVFDVYVRNCVLARVQVCKCKHMYVCAHKLVCMYVICLPINVSMHAHS